MKRINYLAKSLGSLINTSMENIDKDMIVRSSKIKSRELIYYLFNLIQDKDCSALTVATKMNTDKICAATSSAFRKKRDSLKNFHLDNNFKTLSKFCYNNFSKKYLRKYRVVSVDGTYVQLAKELTNDGFKTVQNGTYIKGVINGVYDSTNNIIMDLKLDNTNSERKIYSSQFDLLRKNDIVIHDRGYYSYDLYNKLNNKGINVIFRMRSNIKFVKKFANSKKTDTTITITDPKSNKGPIKIRLVKYTIRDTTYLLGTNCFYKRFSINVLQDLYHQRWSIEEHFKTLKHSLSLNNFHSKKYDFVCQEINMHKYITLFTKVLENIHIEGNNLSIDEDSQFNFNNNLKQSSDILKIFLYDGYNIEEIIRMMGIIFKDIYKKRPNRHYERVCKKPCKTKNYYYNNKSEVT